MCCQSSEVVHEMFVNAILCIMKEKTNIGFKSSSLIIMHVETGQCDESCIKKKKRFVLPPV